MAIHHSYVPGSPLSTFIASFWLYEGGSPPQPKERRLPDGSVELVINLHDDLTRMYDPHSPEQFTDYRGCVISGPQSTFVLLDANCLIWALGVHFKPGGALPFLPFPASELCNDTLSLETIWGNQATDLRGQLCKAIAPEARFAILERFLIEHLTSSRISHPAVNFAATIMQDAASHAMIATLAERAGLSQTRFVQVFRDAVGLTPKQYARLCRFQRALHLLATGSAATWSDVVDVCGYFDQSHLIHEFQTFAGLSPTAYLALRGEYPNHVPLPT